MTAVFKSSDIESIAGQLERDIANAVRELRDHGGSQKDAEHIVREFRRRTEDETHHAEVGKIPD
jgi:hypothetical protein